MDLRELENRIVAEIKRAETTLGDDVVGALRNALDRETHEIARRQLEAILENISRSREMGVPMCQDTGIVSFYIIAGTDFPHLHRVIPVIKNALRRATVEIPLRENTMDPFTGDNPGDNLGPFMPQIDIMFREGEDIEIHILPKGGGSEYWSRLFMLRPVEGFNTAVKRIVETIAIAGGAPCPPVILGIGIGGTADMAMRLAKYALLRPLGQRHEEKRIAGMEDKILSMVNSLGIGPMGLGGDTTALDVHIEYTYRHPATYPVALAVQCWADRHGVVRIGIDDIY